MAGEKRGKALEVVACSALHSILPDISDADLAVIWDDAVDDLRWKPDLFIAPRGTFPGLCVWVTYAGSENDSQQKFWRNLAELIDVRSVFPNIITASIVAGARIREKFRNAQLHVFHRFYEIEESGVASNLLRGYLDQLGQSGLTASERLHVAAEMTSNDCVFSNLIDSVGASLTQAMESCAPIHTSFWNTVECLDLRPEQTRVTHYRRGVAKASLFSRSEIERLTQNQRLQQNEDISVLHDVGILSRSIGGSALIDEEVRFAVTNVPELADLIDAGLSEVGRSSVERVRDCYKLRDSLIWIRNNWEAIKDAGFLSEQLRTIQAIQPGYLLLGIKAVLANKLGRQGQGWLEEVEDESGVIKSVLIGLVIPKFERGVSPLPAEVRRAIASALSRRICTAQGIEESDLIEIVPEFVRKEIETSLTCHGIDGAEVFVKRELARQGIAFSEGRLVSGLAEMFGYSARDFGMSSGFVVDGDIFVHCRTVRDTGRDHKVKELAARVYQSKREWNGERFVSRTGVGRRCVLVVDGDWRLDDLMFLNQAGWDAICYPDAFVDCIESMRG
jgi:hypothetical protein